MMNENGHHWKKLIKSCYDLDKGQSEFQEVHSQKISARLLKYEGILRVLGTDEGTVKQTEGHSNS